MGSSSIDFQRMGLCSTHTHNSIPIENIIVEVCRSFNPSEEMEFHGLQHVPKKWKGPLLWMAYSIPRIFWGSTWRSPWIASWRDLLIFLILFGVHDLQCGYPFQFSRFVSHLPTSLLVVLPGVPVFSSHLFPTFLSSSDDRRIPGKPPDHFLQKRPAKGELPPKR